MLTARYRQGELAYLLGDLHGARRALEAFTRENVAHRGLEMAWTYLGDTCFGLQDFAQARIAYERSLAAYPAGRLVLRAKYGLGRTLAQLGEYDRALSVLRELASTGGPEWVDKAWLQIGLIRQSRGQFAAAVEAFTALEQAAPQSALTPEAQLHRALALARLNKSGDAETLLRTLAGSAAGAHRASGRPRAGDRRARAQPSRRGFGHAGGSDQALSEISFRSGFAVSIGRSIAEAEPSGRGSGAFPPSRRNRPQ